MKLKQIVFTKKDTAELLEKEVEPLRDNHVLIKTLFSAISCGTERANITGDLNISPTSPTLAESLFPRTLGYSSSGIVMQVGKNVTSVKEGDRVASIWTQHKNYNTIPEENVIKIPSEKVSFEEAAFGNIAAFPLAAVRKTMLEIGESMLVMGQGTLGQLAVMFAKAAGAVPVIAADPVKERRDAALKMGADFALDPTEVGFAERVKSLTDGGANCIIEVTGRGEGLDMALDCAARFARVALLGCTRDKNFTIDYYRKIHFPGITIVGAHTRARPKNDSRPGFFTEQDDVKAFLKLCEAGRINFKDKIADPVSPADCTKVYTRLVNDPDFPPYTVFDWRMLK